MFGLPVRVAQIFFMGRGLFLIDFIIFMQYSTPVHVLRGHMCWLRKYVAALLMMFLAPMVSLGLDKDSTFFSLLQEFEEIGPYAQCFNMLQVTEERKKTLETTAMDAGYTSYETLSIVGSFLRNNYPKIRREFFINLFSDVSEEEMREAVAYFDSEQAHTVIQNLSYVCSKKCVDKLVNQVISDVIDLLVDKKVPKKKCNAPSKYQKLCLSYLESSGAGDFLLNELIDHCVEGERDSEIFAKLSKCVVTELVQACYPTVSMEDLLFFDKFKKSNVGSKINECAELLPYGIESFFDRLESEFESFLVDWMKNNPPAHWNVTPGENPVEEDDNKGNI